MLVLSGSIGTSIDCAALVPEPIDVVPIRSAQAIHTAMARRFAGRSLVEIGTRNGDGMSCFARVARTALAVEMQQSYCDRLQERLIRLRTSGAGSFEIVCDRFERARSVRT